MTYRATERGTWLHSIYPLGDLGDLGKLRPTSEDAPPVSIMAQTEVNITVLASPCSMWGLDGLCRFA